MLKTIKNFFVGNKLLIGAGLVLLTIIATLSNLYADSLEEVSALKADKEELASVIENNEQRIDRYKQDIVDLNQVIEDRKDNEVVVEEKVVERIKVVKEYVEVSPEFARCYDVLLPPKLRVEPTGSDENSN